MFRDDQQAMALQNDDLRREVESLRAENAALRNAISTSVPSAVPLTARGLYGNQPLALTEVERVALGVHGMEHFPVWLAVLLHVLTFGVFSIVYYGGQGARLPRLDAGDPSAQKAVGFFFIPYFNLYWLFAFPTRLADRINLQLRLRGERPAISQALMVACSLSTALIFVPFFWIFAVVQIQQAINRVVALGPVAPRAVESAAAQADPITGVRVDLGAGHGGEEAPAPAWAEQAAWQVDPARRSAQR